MTSWRWLQVSIVNALHDRQIAEHGGLEGIRDPGTIESALARPAMLVAYGNPDAAALAAAYCYGMVKNHGYADGNKRIGWLMARVFLADNGFILQAEAADVVRLVQGVAAGTVSEADLADWIRVRIAPE